MADEPEQAVEQEEVEAAMSAEALEHADQDYDPEHPDPQHEPPEPVPTSEADDLEAKAGEGETDAGPIPEEIPDAPEAGEGEAVQPE
jgi:hypothetical protein